MQNQKFLIALLGIPFFLAGCSSYPSFDHPVVVTDKAGLKTGAQAAPSFVVRNGESIEQVLRRLAALDSHIYILDQASVDVAFRVQSQEIQGLPEFKEYLTALGYELSETPVGKGYVRLLITKPKENLRINAAQNCTVEMGGVVPVGEAITKICGQAGLTCSFTDKGAADYTGVHLPVAYSGDCPGALEHLAQKTDLSLTFNDANNQAEFKMFETALIDVGALIMRDRRVSMGIDGTITATANGSATNGQSTLQNSQQQNGQAGGGAGGGNNGTPASTSITPGKGQTSSFQTAHITNVVNLMKQSISPFGTWAFLPESGQISIRDKPANVRYIKEALGKAVASYQDEIYVTVTFYRLTQTKENQTAGNLVRAINSDLIATFGAVPTIGGAASGLAYSHNSDKATVQVLSTWGSVEELDTYSMTVTPNVLKAAKFGKNIEYIRNLTTSYSTVGTVSQPVNTIEQANAIDGAFMTVIARKEDGDRYHIDLGAYVNNLDTFDTTVTSTVAVKSQRSYERTIDTRATLREGVPFVSDIYKISSRQGSVSTLPGFENTGIFGSLLGSRNDTIANTQLIVVIEAGRNQ